jgi:transcriptional regulator with XRE-family HTH domain
VNHYNKRIVVKYATKGQGEFSKKMVVKKTFGSALKLCRTEKGLTQQALADLVQMHRVELAKLEADKHKPTWRTVQKLAKALGVSCEMFADEEADEPPPAKKSGRKKK